MLAKTRLGRVSAAICTLALAAAIAALGAVPAPALGQGPADAGFSTQVAEDIASGTCDGVDWRITPERELILGKAGEVQELSYRKLRNCEDYPWNFHAELSSVRFAGTVRGNGSMASMFCQPDGCSITSIDLSNFDASNVTNMHYMFFGCDRLTSLDLSPLDTSRVTNMQFMFGDCSGLKSLDLSPLDTSRVTNMRHMFQNCQTLGSLDLSSLDTSSVTDMGCMFDGCELLESLDLSSLDTSNVKYMECMFRNCSSLTTITAPADWHVAKSSDAMFWGCTSLVGGSGTGYDPGHADGQYARLDGLDGLPGYFTEGAAKPVSGLSVSVARATYTGKELKPAVTVRDGKRKLERGADYTLSYKDNVDAGTATVTVIGKGNYAGAKTAKFKITQAVNSAKAAKTAVKKAVKAAKLKNKALMVKLPKVRAKFGKAKWATVAKDKKKALKLKGGKVLVKKGAKKGAYTIKLKAKVKKTKNYKAASTKVVTVKVTVK